MLININNNFFISFSFRFITLILYHDEVIKSNEK
nr:MAG TPA: hypothetical protein [Caudoviricetes sp.]